MAQGALREAVQIVMKRVSALPHRPDGLRRRVIVSGSLLGVSQLIRVGARAVYVIVLARYLGPEAFGLFNYGMAWCLAFLSLTYLGFDLILAREVGQDDSRSRELLAAAFRLLALVTLLAASLSLALIVLTESGVAARVLGLFSVALVGRAVAAWVSFVLIAQRRSGQLLLLDGGFRIGEALIGSAALVAGADLVFVVALHAVSWWIQSLAGLARIGVLEVLRTPTSVAEGLALLGAKPFIFGLAGMFQVWIAQGPIVLFRLLGGEDSELGKIAVAFQIFGLMAGVAWVTARALLPELSRSLRSGGDVDAVVVRLLGPGVLLSIAVLVGASVIFAEPVMIAVFGATYAGVSAYLPVAIAASGAYTVAVAGHQILSAHFRDGAILLGTFLGASLTTAITVLIWPHAPLMAPFFGLGVGALAWASVVVWSLRAATRFSLMEVFIIPLFAGGAGVLAAGSLKSSGSAMATVAMLLVLLIGVGAVALWRRSSDD